MSVGGLRAHMAANANVAVLQAEIDAAELAILALDSEVTHNYQRVLQAALPGAPAEGDMVYVTDTDRIMVYDGAQWVILSEPSQAWTNWFASGVTTTGGTFDGRYHRTDGFCDIDGSFTLGVGSAITGPITFNLPFAAKLLPSNALKMSFKDTGVQTYPAVSDGPITASVGPIEYLASGSAGIYVNVAQCSSTVPFIWGSTDRISVSGRFEMNQRWSF